MEHDQARNQTVTRVERRKERRARRARSQAANGTGRDATGQTPDRAGPGRSAPLPHPAPHTRLIPHRRIPAPRLQLLLLLTAHGGGTSDLHRKKTAELFSPEPQRPHQPLHGGERGRHKMAATVPPGATASELPACTAARREGGVPT